MTPTVTSIAGTGPIGYFCVMQTRSKTIYLIDDSPVIIARVNMILEEMGFCDIHSAASYREAEILLQAHTPDLVILDINLGDRSGIDLLQLIGELYPTVTVIMMSNQSSSQHRAICRQLGASAFIDKSIEFGNIRKIVQSFIQP